MQETRRWTMFRRTVRSRRLTLAAIALTALALATALVASAEHTGAAGRGAVAHALAGELGISAQQLRGDLASGQSLASIATANGSSPATLQQSILSLLQRRLDQAVANGKLTSEQEQSRLGRANTVVGKLLATPHPFAALTRLRVRALVLRASASYFGLSAAALRGQLGAGTTLAQLAATPGKSASQLEQYVLAALQARLGTAVSNGRLSPAREQALLTNAQQRLDTLLGLPAASG